MHPSLSPGYPAHVMDRRTPAQTIATSIATSGEHVADVEKAAGIRQGELQSYLNGSDIELDSLMAVSGLLGFSAREIYGEETR